MRAFPANIICIRTNVNLFSGPGLFQNLPQVGNKFEIIAFSTEKMETYEMMTSEFNVLFSRNHLPEPF
jgi:hypothetical protein